MAVSFFDAFSSEEVARICASGTRVHLPEGWSPISERTPADKAYLILDGTVSVRQHGREIARLGPGDIVGEAAIMNRTLRTATIVALTRLELVHFTAEALHRLGVEMPRFQEVLEAVVRDRVAPASDPGTPGQAAEPGGPGVDTGHAGPA